MFADDTNLFFAGDIEQETNKLSLNWTKTELVSFSKTNIKELSIIDHTITSKSTSKYLGIEIDGGLDFSNHIGSVVKKLNRQCGVVAKLRNYAEIFSCYTIRYT